MGIKEGWLVGERADGFPEKAGSTRKANGTVVLEAHCCATQWRLVARLGDISGKGQGGRARWRHACAGCGVQCSNPLSTSKDIFQIFNLCYTVLLCTSCDCWIYISGFSFSYLKIL